MLFHIIVHTFYHGTDYIVTGDQCFSTDTDQIPAANATVASNPKAVLYMGGSKPEKQVTVPDLTGKSLNNARTTLQNLGLYVRVSGGVSEGTQTVTKQDVAHGTQVAYGAVVTVETSDTSQQSH